MPKVVKKIKKAKKASEEEVYSVEKITEKKIENGKVFYFLKWHGYSDSENTWEPEENLNCPELIERYEESLKSGGDNAAVTVQQSPSKVLDGISMSCPGSDKKEKKRKFSKSNSDKKSSLGSSLGDAADKKSNENGEPDILSKANIEYKSGFAKNWEAEEILGATEDKDQLLFLIKWYGSLLGGVTYNSVIKDHM